MIPDLMAKGYCRAAIF